MPTHKGVDFGEVLRRDRVAAGLTQEELAGRAGLSARAVSDLERGLHRAPHRDTVQRLADALGLGQTERRDLVAGRLPRLISAAPGGAPRAWPRAAHERSLPTQLTVFIGRECEVGEVNRLLGASRLITLIGPGGVGKT